MSATGPIVSYLPEDLAEPAELVAAIRKRRGGSLLHLDRVLLHSIPFARGWNALIGEVRQQLALSPKLREIAMCGVAVLNRADYEFIHHAPELIKAGGTPEQVQALGSLRDPGQDLGMFSGVEQDAIALTRAMTLEVSVPEAITRRLQSALGDTELVELVGTVAAYNMVSRFLVALGITPEDSDHGR